MNSYGFFLTKEDIKEVEEAKNEFKKENPNKRYSITWEYGECHLGEVATCYAKYTDKQGVAHKDKICTICH